jgi:hypothetical protein
MSELVIKQRVCRTWGLGHETDSRVGEDIMYQLLLTEAEPKEKYG